MRSIHLGALFASAALMNAAMASASAVSTLVAADALGPGWGGVPNTAGVAGTGLGAIAMSRMMSRHGRRRGLVCGYSAALAGAVLTVAAAAGHSMIGLISGMAMLGLGNAGAQLSRYAAADLYPPHRRGMAIGAVVWAGTAGAVGGPLLLMPAQRAAEAAGWTPATGPFLLATLAVGAALVAALGASPARLAPDLPSGSGALFRNGVVRTAAAAIITAQVIMVAVMTSAPLSMHEDGADLGAIGMMLAAHTFGMFALAPLNGWLLDRVGSRPLMIGGLATLAGTSGLVAMSLDGLPLTGTLFLLGYGWNLCLVAGSGLLVRRLPDSDVTRVQGAVEAASWGTSALASTASTLVFVHGGYPVLATNMAAISVTVLVALGGSPARRAATGADRSGSRAAGRGVPADLSVGQREAGVG